jgi:hypothetical protein
MNNIESVIATMSMCFVKICTGAVFVILNSPSLGECDLWMALYPRDCGPWSNPMSNVKAKQPFKNLFLTSADHFINYNYLPMYEKSR